MKLIIIPLAVMTLIAILCMTGLNGTEDYTQYSFGYYTGTDAAGNRLTLNTAAGTPVCYYDGSSVYNTTGNIQIYEANGYFPQEVAWYNGTAYQLFYDFSGAEPVYWGDLSPLGSFSRPQERIAPGTWSIAGALGFIALVGVLMFAGTLVGLRIFGSGESELSVGFLLLGTFYITIWLVLTGITYTIFIDTGFFPFYVLYFVLTLVYAVGIMMNISPSGND